MSTVAEIVAARKAAGERYVAAVTELRAAITELAGYDMATANKNFPCRNDDRPSGTFQVSPDEIRVMLRHPDFLTLSGAAWMGWHESAQDRADQILKSVRLEDSE